MIARSLICIAVVASLSLADTARAHMACAPQWVVPILLTDVSAPLPTSTAFVLTLAEQPVVPDAGVSTRGGSTNFFPTATALARGATRISLATRVLSPRLAILVPTSPPSPGHWVLEGLATPVAVDLVAPAAAPAVTPPGVRGIDVRTASGSRRVRIGGGQFRNEPYTNTTTYLQLRDDVPHGWIAAILSWNSPAGASLSTVALFTGDPLGALANRPRDFVVGRSGRPCSAMPAEPAPTLGLPTTLAWIDGSGRVSAPVPVGAVERVR